MIETGDKRIQLKKEGQLAVLTITRPEKLNALDYDMILALERSAQIIDADLDLRVAIITGEGDKSFCAGGDIAAWSGMPPEEFALKWIRHGHRAFDALARLRVPLIAALNGHALGGGLEIAATADLRVAEDHVRIGLPEAGLGIIPGWSGTQRAARRFGAQVTRRMAVMGEIFDARQALTLGIVDKVVPKGHSLAAAREVASQILQRGPIATQAVKMLVNAAEGEDAERAIEAVASLAAASNVELREGVAAFKEKRKPRF
jgi:enoyl-CoA hydratase